MIEFFLPMRPPRTTAQTQGRRAYKSQALVEASQKLTAALAPHKPPKPLTGPLRLVVKWIWYTPDKRKWGQYKTTRPDTDNLQKLFKDRMGACRFYKDDAQVASDVIEKFWGEIPGIYVRLEKL